jgi:hypothetical protein
MVQIKVVEKMKAYSMSINVFSGSRADYEIIWKNMVQPGRPQITI